jgi:hypothetical protein
LKTKQILIKVSVELKSVISYQFLEPKTLLQRLAKDPGINQTFLWPVLLIELYVLQDRGERINSHFLLHFFLMASNFIMPTNCLIFGHQSQFCKNQCTIMIYQRFALGTFRLAMLTILPFRSSKFEWKMKTWMFELDATSKFVL